MMGIDSNMSLRKFFQSLIYIAIGIQFLGCQSDESAQSISLLKVKFDSYPDKRVLDSAAIYIDPSVNLIRNGDLVGDIERCEHRSLKVCLLSDLPVIVSTESFTLNHGGESYEIVSTKHSDVNHNESLDIIKTSYSLFGTEVSTFYSNTDGLLMLRVGDADFFKVQGSLK